MHFLYRIQPTRPEMLTYGPTEQEAATVSEHFLHLKEATERGVVILAGRTLTSESFGIVIFNAENQEEAEMFMRSDPAVRGGVMRAELFPFGLALLTAVRSEE